MDDNKELIAQCEAKAKLWLAPAFDEETCKSVQSMLDNEDKTDLIESFYKDLEFGTGGLRGWIAAWIYCTGLFHGDNGGRAGCVGADDRT